MISSSGRNFQRPYCLHVLDSNMQFSERKLTLLNWQIERIISKKYSIVLMVESGQFTAKKSGFD